jgi:NAD-dependent deacetylase
MRQDGTPRLIEEVRLRLARARRVFVLTGAGLNPDDAVPSFSDCGTRLGGRSVREIAAQEPFFEDPVAVWRWYDEHRRRLSTVQPGPAHRALAELERRVETCTLATECVDGLHRLAGSKAVLELRGNLWQVRCTRCGMRSVNREIPIPNPPSCPLCTGLVRPFLVWQGEEVPQDLLVRSFEALTKCEVLLLAGIPGKLPPAPSFVGVARKAGAFVVEVSPPPAAGSPADVLLTGSPAEILPLLVPDRP